MKRTKFLTICIISFLMQGCVSIHSGIICPSQVQLNGPNFKFVKSIQGVATATYFLGIGGNNRLGLINEAKSNMYQNYNFGKNQTITNITIDDKRMYLFYPILYIKTVIISADIIQFGEEIENGNSSLNRNQENYPSEDESIIERLAKTNNLKEISYSSIDDVNIGDFVKYISTYNDIIYAKVVGKVSNKKVKLELFPTPGTVIYEEINFRELKKVVF